MNLHPRTRRSVAVTLAFLLGAVVTATTYPQREPTEMLFEASRAVLGTVTGVDVSDEDGTPWTTVTLEIERALVREAPGTSGASDGDTNGNANDDPDEDTDRGTDEDQTADTSAADPERITLTFLGGEVPGGPRLTVAGTPRWEVGERVLVFAYDDEGLASPLVGVRQGLWRVRPGGLQDDDGAFLSVGADGRLVRNDEGTGVEPVLEAAAALLRGDTVPANETAPDGAGDADAQAATSGATDADTPADADTTDADTTDAANSNADTTDAADTTAAAASDDAPADEGSLGEAAAPPAKTVSITVDDRDGPLLLSSAVAEAAAAWSTATDDLARFELVDESDRTVRYGDLGLLGPDAWSLTLVWSLPDGSSRLETLVSPTVGEARRAVLLHELGVTLGLPEGDGGVMVYTVDPNGTTPSVADAAAFRAQQSFVPEDLDRNGVVDFYDLEAFGRAYGTEGVNLAADIDGDGRVDDADLARLTDAYTFTPPREAPPAP